MAIEPDGPKLLSLYLARCGLRQRAFARTARISESVLSLALRRRRRPGVETMAAIERATGGVVPMRSWISMRIYARRAA